MSYKVHKVLKFVKLSLTLGTFYFINFSLCVGQTHKLDSLYTAIKTEQDDTNKVNTLNNLSEQLWRTGQDSLALLYASNAASLAKKLDFKKAMAAAYRNSAITYWYLGNYPRSLEYDSLALLINMSIGNKSGIASNYGNMGIVYLDQGKYTAALEYFMKGLAISKEIGNKSGMGSNMGNIGLVYWNQGNYPVALDYYFKALEVNTEIGNKAAAANNMGNIAVIYNEQGNKDKALEYDLKTLAIEQETGDKNGMARNLGNIGLVYSEINNSDKAFEYDEKALALSRELGNKNDIARILGYLGTLYLEKKNLSKSLDTYSEALTINREIGNKDGIAVGLCNLASVNSKLKKFALARTELDSSLVLAKSLGEKDIIKDVYLGYTDIDSSMGNYKTAYEDYKKVIIYRDSMINEANTKKTVQAQMNFDFEQKQAAEKAEQDKKDAIAEQNRKRQIIIRNSFIAGFVLMIALAFFIFRGYRQKQKDNILITKQKEEVEKQKHIAEEQKKLVEEKNKDILDSINYAKRLQQAILPPLNSIQQALPQSFVLYKPKDIVAGDFYWMEHIPLLAGEGQGEVVLIAAADCTGHGVPGALVSVVCSNALHRTVNELKIIEPGKILDKTRELVLETFAKSESNVQDGMDISLLAISRKSLVDSIEVQWSGAYNSLWYIQNGELKEVPADKQPIGKTDNPKPFTTHSIPIPNGEGKGGAGTTLYLFTDGYADQFGGPKGKKFKYKQLEELLVANSSKSMDEQKNLLNETIEKWKGSLEQVDDILIIGIRV
jgi:tetratricopeptide (TPR) repeat protein